MTLGDTNFDWEPATSRVVQRILSEVGPVTCNTYQRHPRLLYRLFPGVAWSRHSIDVWGAGGRGDPLAIPLGVTTVNLLLGLSGEPQVRHIIWRHALWTSWGGWSLWTKDDHAGTLRHVHVTFWP